ncbi:PREDICTED: uncharacterized protein LOC108577197 [Habropoda laboriosa]|uniref:uncharacterized protein LOC108577197 n=1 Tax=Habropoda laboriosa TaxID=597456 RepID=UPI00083D6B3D|nr:PREDICTED: uncharacterized protein LOC108577197 [Habropoda laboriosa]
MFDDCAATTKMNSDESKGDYAICNSKLDNKCFIAWSPLEENKCLFKHRYVSCSRSVPRKSKRFIRYKINRSLNFDATVHNSSSENSSFEENKHLTRSAKIMRALDFNSSPAYYGKTKIKKSLNFNLTPSPKRFTPVRKSIRKSLSLNFNSLLSVPNKFLNYDDNPSDSANSSLIFSSSESIDENQNETPLQQDTKEHEMLHYSTPNAKLSRKSQCSASFRPLLRSRLKETIDNIVYVTATPTSQSLKRIKNRSKCTNDIGMNTSRNLFYEFYDKDDDRPCTPENVICIIPESMSAIKRSHKKERSSRWSDRCVTQFPSSFTNDEDVLQNRKHVDPLQDSKSNVNLHTNKNSNCKELALSRSEDDMSDTGSLFDYTEEQENVVEESKNIFENIKVKTEENAESFSEIEDLSKNDLLQDSNSTNANNLSNRNIDLIADDKRSVTPELVAEVALELQKSVTPENHINILERIAKDSIKNSHKKLKDTNKRRLFSPKVLQGKLEAAEEQGGTRCWQNFEQHEDIQDNKIPVEQNYLDVLRGERSCTPEKVNSSRLLLTQFSSVKKSHKKDKHNKILSGFLKRQEYFNKDMELVKICKHKGFNSDYTSECKGSAEDFSSDLDVSTNIEDSAFSVVHVDANTSLDKLSPSKRKKSLDISADYETSVSCNSELEECDTSKEEFKIFTPLKRKRSLIASAAAKEHLNFYGIPSVKIELAENVVADISLSRCLTPVPNFQSNYVQTDGNNIIKVIKANNDNNDSDDNNGGETHDYGSNDTTGRSTPRNMSTTELYVNLDSIKKSHKKNKRGNSSRKGLNLFRNNFCTEEENEMSTECTESAMHSASELSNNDITSKSINDKSIDYDSTDDSTSLVVIDNEKCASTSMENELLNTTPPNCLKTKSYIRLIQDTSIKRSHKKVRDQKKQEITIETDELSDDGSIFGEEEKLDCTQDLSTHHE